MINWADYFFYDESSPTFLRWKVVIRSGRNRRIMRDIGDIAGNLNKRLRYSQVQLDSQVYSVHRIIWELHNHKIPDNMVLDHIDGNTKNNNILNLRLVSKIVNMRNQKKPINNSSGHTGVSLMETKGLSYWIASWRNLDGKFKQKCFSVNKLGHEAKELAVAYRKQMIAELNKQNAGYTERYGK